MIGVWRCKVTLLEQRGRAAAAGPPPVGGKTGVCSGTQSAPRSCPARPATRRRAPRWQGESPWATPVYGPAQGMKRCGEKAPRADTATKFHKTFNVCKYLFLQVVVVAVMQQKTEDIARINHGIDATFLQLLSQPGLHWTQSMKQRHFRDRAGAGVGAGGAFRW